MAEQNGTTTASDEIGNRLNQKKHTRADFDLSNELGNGAYAKVFIGKVINKDSPAYDCKYAVKVMEKKHIMKFNKINAVKTEKLVFLKTHKCKFTCHMHYSFQDDYSLYMVLDLCENKELSHLIWKYIQLDANMTRFYVSEIISALDFMHGKGIYHRDLKPENVLIHKDGHIRLTDFGTCRYIDPDDPKAVEEARIQQMGALDDSDGADKEAPDDKKRERRGSFVGTANYVPPELLSNRPYSFAGMDFWALGICIYECLSGKQPFFAEGTDYQIFKKIEAHDYSIPSHFSSDSTAIIEAFLNPSVKDRLGMNGFEDIHRHPWFSSIDDWSPDGLYNRSTPTMPEIPASSPFLLEDEKKNDESESSSDGITGGPSSSSKKKIKSSAKRPPVDDARQKLYARWKPLLRDDEAISFGSQVEMSKLWGFSSDSCVLLVTDQSRILIVDHSKMRIKGQIYKSHLIAVEVVDTDHFTIQTRKKTSKFKAIGVTAKQWKDAINRT